MAQALHSEMSMGADRVVGLAGLTVLALVAVLLVGGRWAERSAARKRRPASLRKIN